MQDLTVRPATLAERPALVALQRRASLANPGDRALLEAHPDLIDTPAAQFLAGDVQVCVRDDRPLGFSAIEMRPDGDADLDALFVEPDLWRSGIGRLLVSSVAARARAHGAGTLHVIGNPHAERFYSRIGFELRGSRKLEFGTGLVMTLSLSPDADQPRA